MIVKVRSTSSHIPEAQNFPWRAEHVPDHASTRNYNPQIKANIVFTLRGPLDTVCNYIVNRISRLESEFFCEIQ